MKRTVSALALVATESGRQGQARTPFSTIVAAKAAIAVGVKVFQTSNQCHFEPNTKTPRPLQVDNVVLRQAPAQKALIQVIPPPKTWNKTSHQGMGCDVEQTSPPLNQTPQAPPYNRDWRGGNYRPPPLVLQQARASRLESPYARHRGFSAEGLGRRSDHPHG